MDKIDLNPWAIPARIVEKKEIAQNIKLIAVTAPKIAARAKAGQFVVLRVHEKGERIPLTIVNADVSGGLITLIFQEVGKTTKLLGQKRVGDTISDLVGPLGQPVEIEKFGTVACIGGGVGIAEAYPVARAMKAAGNYMISIIGSRSKNLLILEEEMRAASHELKVATDDGTYGSRGFVTDLLSEYLKAGGKIDLVIAIGPLPMMKAVCEVTRPYNIKTFVSLSSIMIDATGMCGVCRVSVGGQIRFACVHGPKFNGHLVDFDELSKRMSFYREQEKIAIEYCALESADS